MKIVIAGAGQVGSYLAKTLSRESNEITVIDTDAKRLSALTSVADVVAVQGNPTSIKIQKDAGVARADLFVAVNPYVPQEVNLVCAILAKNLGAAKVTARLEDEEYLAPENKLMFKEMGMDLMFFPEKIAAEEIIDQLKHLASSDSMDFAHGKLQMAVFKIEENSPLIDMKLGELVEKTSGENAQFRIIAISRGDDTIIPKVDTKFQYHDIVFTISLREGMPVLLKYFGKNNIEVDRVMVLGGSEIAEQMAKALAKQVSEIKIIESDKDRCIELLEMLPSNVTVVNGDGRNADFLAEEDIRSYDAFAALSGSDETNVLACVIAKKFGIERVIAQVENVEYLRLAEELGVDTVINKKLLTAARMLKFTLSGKARTVKYMSGTKAEVLEYTVAPGSAITKGALKDISFPHNAIVGGAVRGSDAFIAVGDTVIEAYDRVAVFALPEVVKDVDKFFK